MYEVTTFVPSRHKNVSDSIAKTFVDKQIKDTKESIQHHIDKGPMCDLFHLDDDTYGMGFWRNKYRAHQRCDSVQNLLNSELNMMDRNYTFKCKNIYSSGYDIDRNIDGDKATLYFQKLT